MLAVKYWPGKLTILAPVLDRSISSKVTAGGSLLGVRVPSNKCALDLLEKCRYLVGTSANISGRPPLRSAGDVRASGLAGFDILLDGGRIAESKESTVFDIQRLQVVRQGALSEKSIFETIGEC
jgi:L-threonylcarbamoyladenylate synthase